VQINNQRPLADAFGRIVPSAYVNLAAAAYAEQVKLVWPAEVSRGRVAAWQLLEACSLRQLLWLQKVCVPPVP
jgi:hypothetical protein